MDDIERLKQNVREGRIPADRLVVVVVRLQRELQAARRRVEDLEKKLGGSATVEFAEPFSLRSEERRQEARGKFLDCCHVGRRGRAVQSSQHELDHTSHSKAWRDPPSTRPAKGRSIAAGLDDPRDRIGRPGRGNSRNARRRPTEGLGRRMAAGVVSG